MRTTSSSLAILAIALAGVGCAKARSSSAASQGECTGCHGDASRVEASELLSAAPPLDVHFSASSAAVGAHQAHLHAGALAPALACAECHVVPANSDHSRVAAGINKVFVGTTGTIARTGGATPSWNGATCAVYCHGSTLGAGAGSHTSPSWTDGSPAVATCGSCHGFPPAGAHVSVDKAGAALTTAGQCYDCHAQTITSATGTMDVQRHVDGVVEVTGPHAADYRNPTAHGPDAIAGLATCTVCHGASFGTVLSAASGLSCNACHAAPATFSTAGVNLATYAGSADWQHDCRFCHGDHGGTRAGDATFPMAGGNTVAVRANRAGPPLGAVATHPVGAHLAHFDAATNLVSTPLQCSECHGPTLPTDLGHVSAGINLAWGTLATANGVTAFPAAGVIATPSVAPTCANYCHGVTLKGGSANGQTAGTRIAWTDTVTCGSCHGFPPSTTPANGHNYKSIHSAYHCNECHATTMAAGASDTIGNKALHLNGAIDFSRPAGAYGSQVIIRTDLGAAGIDYSCNVSCHSAGAGGTHTWTGW